jgi:hypothetical protein
MNIEFVWYHEGLCTGWFGPPYEGGCVRTFEDMPLPAGPGLLLIHARGDYTPGGEEELPEMIALDLDRIYAPVELNALHQLFVENVEVFNCDYPGTFPALENNNGRFGQNPYCIPAAGPDTGATILSSDDLGQDVEWTQSFVLGRAGLRELLSDGTLTFDVSTLNADLYFPSFFEFRLSYDIPEPGTLFLFAIGLLLMKRRGRSSAARRRLSA